MLKGAILPTLYFDPSEKRLTCDAVLIYSPEINLQKNERLNRNLSAYDSILIYH